MRINSDELLSDLVADTRQMIKTTERDFGTLSEEDLLMKPSPDKWSIAECLEHLNLFADYYHPAITKAMEQAGPGRTSDEFKTGMVGNFFAKSMLPKKRGMKLGSPGDKNPAKTGLPENVLKRFLNHQKEMLTILGKARKHDLNKIKVALSVSTLIKFKLGDVLRIVIYHNQRHVLQAVRVLDTLNSED
ncbi:MAG: DinB family protein [Saprospirales bacterium]|nr:MAG: DinB family protein [Saprospirales bacterium]